MRDVMIGLQFSAIIPILVILIYRPSLNLFFRLLFASILLSALFDFIGTMGLFRLRSNIRIYIVYYLCNTILITFMWKSLTFYSDTAKNFVKTTGIIVFLLMILAALYYNANKESFYIIASLNVLVGILFALFFYYQKLSLSSYTSPLSDPYFFAASGYILFSLSTIIILSGMVQYSGHPFLEYTMVFRQLLYLIYNLIIGYAFYVLYISQIKSQWWALL